MLVVSPDRTVARRVRRALVPDPQALAVHAVAGLPAARGALHAGPVAAIALDATGEPPDFAPLAALHAEAPAVPIVALLTGEDPARHAAARAAGALDTLPATRAGGELLRRSLHYVVAQAAAVAALEAGRRDAEALRESRERYRQMFERNQAIKLLIDPASGLIVDANPAAARFYGYTREVLTRMRISDLNTLPANDIAGEMSRALQEERNYFHFRHRLASGQVRDVEVDTSPLEIQGRLLLYSIVHDISDRKRAETELLQERYLLHTIMDHLPDNIYFKDRASRFVRVNRAVAARFGLADPAEAVGRADADFFSPEHAIAAFADEQAIIESGEPILNKEERETWPDGHDTWVATSKLPLRDADGRIVGTFGISSDITERRQAEEAIRSLNAELEARVRDRTAALESLNRELAVEVAERTRAEAALHTRALQQAAIAALGQDALAGADLPDLFTRATGLVAQTLDVEYCEVLELQTDGRFVLRAGVGWRPGLVGTAVVPGGHHSQAGYTLEAGAPVVVDDLPAESRFQGPPLLFEHGVISGMSVVIARPRHPYGVMGAYTRRRRRFTADDVHFLQAIAHVLATAILRRRDEEELARRGEELEQALHLRDDFLSIASHELKTPITSIKAYAQLLARQVDMATNERARRGLRTILRQSDQLTALINELLDVTRIESGRLELRRAPVDLTDLLTEVVGQMQLLSDAHPVHLSITPPPPLVEGDAERLRQVLVNLLENAVKYSPGGGTVDVRLTSTDAEATITVHDEGIGIPADQLPHIFDRFYRARNAATPHYTGLGLGLHISREITLRHGGRLAVDSVEGAGSTFTLTLPLTPPPDAG